MDAIDTAAVRAWLIGLQARITDTIESIDGRATFLRDDWAKIRKRQG